VLLAPLFNDVVADTPVTDTGVIGVAVTEFNKAVACSPDTVEVGEKIRKPENGTPENGARPNIQTPIELGRLSPPRLPH
jgi:hypothetical protein